MTISVPPSSFPPFPFRYCFFWTLSIPVPVFLDPFHSGTGGFRPFPFRYRWFLTLSIPVRYRNKGCTYPVQCTVCVAVGHFSPPLKHCGTIRRWHSCPLHQYESTSTIHVAECSSDRAGSQSGGRFYVKINQTCMLLIIERLQSCLRCPST